MTPFGTLCTGLLVIPFAAATGCGNLNQQVGLVGTDRPLPALAEPSGQTELDGRPSLQHGLDRQDWSTVTIQVPREQVAHYPTYTKNFRWQKDRGPWNPAYPTTPGVIIDAPDTGQDIADAVTAPVYAGILLVWAPIDMIFFNQPWNEKRSPSEPYALVPDRTSAHLVDWFDAPSKLPEPRNDSPDESSGSAPGDRMQPHP